MFPRNVAQGIALAQDSQRCAPPRAPAAAANRLSSTALQARACCNSRGGESASTALPAWPQEAAAFMVGLGTLVRPETPLLLAAMLVVLWMRFRHPANCSKLALATLWMTAGLLLPLAPWAARNAANLGRVQFLAPRYAETYGDVL